MQSADRIKFVKIVNAMAAVKPGTGGKLSPEALDLWWGAMSGWPLDEFESAAAHLVRAGEFMPNPFHFEQLRKAAATEACADAWTTVVLANRRGDRTGVTAKAERVVAAMGGWSALRTVLTTELPFREKRFRELWGEIGETDEARTALPQIAPAAGVARLVAEKQMPK